MTRLLLAGIGLVATAGLVGAQDKKADDRVKVEVFLATEHVPKDLKPGTRVDLKIVLSKRIGGNGLPVYTAGSIAAGLEVASVSSVEKPADREAAVRVHLLVPKDMAGEVETARDGKVTVVKQRTDGSVETSQKRNTLRLELPKPDKK